MPRIAPHNLIFIFLCLSSAFVTAQETEVSIIDTAYQTLDHPLSAAETCSKYVWEYNGNIDPWPGGGNSICANVHLTYSIDTRVVEACLDPAGTGQGNEEDCGLISGWVDCHAYVDDEISSKPPGYYESVSCQAFIWQTRKPANFCDEGKVSNALGECVLLEDMGKNLGESCSSAGNPINFINGNKFQREIDFVLPGPIPYEFSRTYNSANAGWTFSVDAKLENSYSQDINGDDLLSGAIVASRPDGRKILFQNSQAQGFLADKDIFDQLDATQVSFAYIKRASDQALEQYQADTGKLVSITYRNGQKLLVGSLIRSTSSNYPFLSITRDSADRISEVKNWFGQTILNYSYDSEGNLHKVTYADGKFKEYLYEDPRFPHALTSVNDEDGIKHVSWDYDSSMRAVSSQRYTFGSAVDRYEFDYTNLSNPTPSVTVKNPLLKDTTYFLTTVNNTSKIERIEGSPTSNCLATNASYTYNASGLIETFTDNEGTRTRYEYNNRGLETRRTEAEGSVLERTVTTEWHADFALPAKISDDTRQINMTYDAKGLLINREISPL